MPKGEDLAKWLGKKTFFHPSLLQQSFTRKVQYITRTSDLEGKAKHTFLSASFDCSVAVQQLGSN